MKFRHYDKRLKEFRYSDIHSDEFYFTNKGVEYRYTIPMSEAGVEKRDYHSLDVERFTGLKDYSGIEIYEGDVLEYYNRYSKHTYTHIVGWDADLACFALFEKGNKWQKESDWIKIENLKVVGNIHYS